MSSPVLFYCNDDLLLRIDAIVSARKIQRNKTKKLPPEVLAKAQEIARKKGALAANAFLSEERQRLRKEARASRVAVLNELVELGLKHIKE